MQPAGPSPAPRGPLMTIPRCARWPFLVLVAMLVAAITLAVRQRGLRVLEVEGFRVRCVGATYGTSHFAPPQRWNRIRAALPQPFSRWVDGSRPVAFRTVRPGLVLWLETAWDVPGATSSALDLRCEWSGTASSLNGIPMERLTDFEVCQASGSPLSGRASGNAWALQAFTTSVFPRRGASLKVQVRAAAASGAEDRTVELQLPNPERGPFSRWLPDRLPAQASAGELEVRLESFRIIASSVEEHETPWGVASLQICANGRQLKGWGVDGLVLGDPTGNQIRGGLTSGEEGWPIQVKNDTAGRVELKFRWPGWAEEPVWRMTVGLQPGAGDLAPRDTSAELWNVPVPGNEGITWIRKQLALGNSSIGVLALAGEHVSLPDRPRDVHGQCTLELEMPMLAEGWRLGVQAADAEGRIQPMPAIRQENPRSLGIEILPGTAAIDLRFTAYRERSVSFLVGKGTEK